MLVVVVPRTATLSVHAGEMRRGPTGNAASPETTCCEGSLRRNQPIGHRRPPTNELPIGGCGWDGGDQMVRPRPPSTTRTCPVA